MGESGLKVHRYVDEQKEQWNQYVQNHPESTVFHRAEWKEVVEEIFGQSGVYLYAEKEGAFLGILPLFSINSFLLGRCLISIAFAVYGGILADNPEVERILFEKAKKITDEENADYLELRNLKKSSLDLPTKELYYFFTLDLPTDPEVVWKQMRKRNRNILRKGIKSGLTCSFNGLGNPLPEELDRFYELFCCCQRALGTPVLPLDFFKKLLKMFPDQTAVFSARHDGKIISSLFVFLHKDTISPYYLGYDSAYLKYAPNNYILWEVIQYGCRQGFKEYDMGRSRQGTGSYEFKRHWGIEPKPLFYEYYLARLKKVPQVNPSNPKYDIPRRIWGKLPLSLTRYLGSKLIKYLP
jgi:FemAB-related protein (PEP-CTERM system-associated)